MFVKNSMSVMIKGRGSIERTPWRRIHLLINESLLMLATSPTRNPVDSPRIAQSRKAAFLEFSECERACARRCNRIARSMFPQRKACPLNSCVGLMLVYHSFCNVGEK